MSQTFDCPENRSFATPDLSLDTAQRETEEFLTVQMPSTLSAVEYEMPRFSEEPNRQTLAACDPRAGSRSGMSPARPMPHIW